MNKLSRLVISLSALLLMSGVALVTPAYATDSTSGSDSQTTDHSDSGSADSSSSGSTGAQNGTGVENHAHDLAEQFKLKAQQQISEQKGKVKAQTEQHRQQACEARKNNLTTRMSNSVTHAKNIKAVIDDKYTKVKDFVTAKQLTVADYSALTSKVDTAQADAAAQIVALQNLDINVDCTSQTVASSVSAFKQAVQSTRDSLKSYRTALVDLINAIKAVSSSTQGSTDTNSTTSNQ